MRYINLSVCVFLALAVLQSCKEESRKTIKTEPVSFEKEGELSLFQSETDSILVQLNIEIADNDYETETGLMYRKGMENDQGMLFVFPEEAMHYFYMKNTEFPLDIVFIKSDKKIASIQRNAPPLSETGLSSQVPVRYVLEVGAGSADRWGLKVGDSISYKKQ